MTTQNRQPIDPVRGPKPPLGELPPEFKKRFGRAMGVALVLAGAALGKFYVWDLFERARLGDGSITYSSKLVFLTAALPIFGVGMAVAGEKFESVLKIDKQRLTKPQIAMLIAIVIAGIAFESWVKAQIADYGYQVH